jgi:hypothetical protein
MRFKSFSLKWWWYGLAEDLYEARKKDLQDLEETERRKGHGWDTPKENLPHGWYSVSMKSLNEGKNIIFGADYCIWDSPQHRDIRSRYAGKIFQRHISLIPPIVATLGGLFGFASFFMQWLCK